MYACRIRYPVEGFKKLVRKNLNRKRLHQLWRSLFYFQENERAILGLEVQGCVAKIYMSFCPDIRPTNICFLELIQ